ncbi:hypothetical protein GGR42_002609 [Saonia flava]|uniref:DUF4870 domain-containing protein n=1 Tax=Saonia flava TaxID=523696 RepID=A0A846QVU8_9FLAO|nr:DUF4870 domain-containing protein [Saonia flava]NJB72118.1 hypothetical protein [Saonia flava]
MTESLSKHERNLSAIIHASTFSRYFIPFGNFILPLILWTANKKDYKFVDYNGKQALNFQISMLLYSIVLGAISIPFFIGFLPDLFDGGFLSWNDFHHDSFRLHFDTDHFPFIWPLGITGLVQAAITVINVVYTILATIRTNEGQTFKYPFTINFIK